MGSCLRLLNREIRLLYLRDEGVVRPGFKSEGAWVNSRKSCWTITYVGTHILHAWRCKEFVFRSGKVSRCRVELSFSPRNVFQHKIT